MILVETKQDSPSLPITDNLPKDEKSSFSFSDLLKGFHLKENLDDKSLLTQSSIQDIKIEEKSTKNSKSDKSSKEELLSLLKIDENELNQKVLSLMTTQELKTLISDAKQYLKEQILKSDGAIKADIKELPKTLQGLLDVAKKLDIPVDTITLEDIQTKTKLPKNLSQAVVKQPSHGEQKQEHLQPIHREEESRKQHSKVATTPLFKAQTTTEHSTEQVVQLKQLKPQENRSKSKADETLKLLLRGDKSSQVNSTLTADFSVASAKVIAPTAPTDSNKSLESLLHGDKQESVTSKLDGLNVAKADSFEVKLNEAKQMIKYLSNDVKSAIEDYKSPFTRVKLQLNPQRLGEVDLTIVQRGKNLHVNISSNSTAIQTLALNATELRTQLNNSGINNATLNFNNSSGSENPHSNQQQRQNEQQKASEEYNYFEDEEQNEEILSSLEIVVPHYA